MKRFRPSVEFVAFVGILPGPELAETAEAKRRCELRARLRAAAPELEQRAAAQAAARELRRGRRTTRRK